MQKSSYDSSSWPKEIIFKEARADQIKEYIMKNKNNKFDDVKFPYIQNKRPVAI